MNSSEALAEKVRRVLRIDGIGTKEEGRAIKSLSYCVAKNRLIKIYMEIVRYE